MSPASRSVRTRNSIQARWAPIHVRILAALACFAVVRRGALAALALGVVLGTVAVPAALASTGRVGAILTNGELIVQEGELSAPWTLQLGNGAVEFDMEGDRTAVLLDNGETWTKTGPLNVHWQLLARERQRVRLSRSRAIVINERNELWAKEGALDGLNWSVILAGAVVEADVAGNRIAAVLSNGQLWVKEGGLDAHWDLVLGHGVVDVELTGDRILARLYDGQLFGKEGPLGAHWIPLGVGTREIAAYGSRIAYVNADEQLFVKEGPLGGGHWDFLLGNATRVALGGDRIGAVLHDGQFWVKEGGLGAHWIFQRGQVRDIALAHSTTPPSTPAPYPTSQRFGGANGVLDTEAEIDEAVAALSTPWFREQFWGGLSPLDKQTLAARDAYVAWGEEPALNNDGEEGSYETWDGEDGDLDTWIPLADQEEDSDIEPGAVEPLAETRAVPVLVAVVVGCRVFCDDLARQAGPLVKRVIRSKRPRPRSWRTQRPDQAWVARAGSNPSRVLGTNLARERPQGATGWAAHHIVPAGHRGARLAQGILEDCGVHPNSALNGVWLPESDEARDRLNTARPPHNKLHTTHYIQNLNKMLQANRWTRLDDSFDGCERVLEAMRVIKRKILAGELPY